ncbi:MAG: hypothetical protein OEV85_11535 [Candidatus Thorarchaeota archaeon]|nr:hypothetical protein [Candidatus Thorarchaeota archaeon]
MTEASIGGTMLHNQVLPCEFDESPAHSWISFGIIILIVVIGIMWIVW